MPRTYWRIGPHPTPEIEAELFTLLRVEWLPHMINYRDGNRVNPADAARANLPSGFGQRLNPLTAPPTVPLWEGDAMAGLLSICKELAKPLLIVKQNGATWTASRRLIKDWMRPHGGGDFDERWASEYQFALNGWSTSKFQKREMTMQARPFNVIQIHQWHDNYYWTDPPFAHRRNIHTLEV